MLRHRDRDLRTMANVKFVLIMSTLGRDEDVRRFLESLDRQTHRDFALYVCDQNDDDRLKAVLASFEGRFPIKVTTSAKGLSRGRNAALKLAGREAGGVAPDDCCIVFPDDDCWYDDPRLLEEVASALQENPALDGVTARSVDQDGVPSARSSPDVEVEITPSNIFVGSMAISYCIFLRKPFVDAVGQFDEALGVGAGTPWGAGEESDYLIRGLRAGRRLRYLPTLRVRHPRKDALSDAGRFMSYAMGHGRVLRKNGYSAAFLARDVVKALGAFAVRSIGQRRLMVAYLARAWGYVRGFAST